MNVLILAPSPPPYGGMALQARLLERLLRQDGVAVTAFASNLTLPTGLRWAQSIPGLRTCVRFFVLVFRLWRQARRVDVVHVFAASWLYFFTVAAPAVLIGRMRGKRVILNYRGGDAPAFFPRFGRMARPVFRAADVVTAPSTFLAELIRRWMGCPVSIVPNILDTTAFPYRRRATFTPRLLVSRHLEKIYDVESILKAFRLVQERYPEATLWIAGTGSQEAHLRKAAAAAGLRGVVFLGGVSHPEMRALYEQCDILVNASRVDNFPGALLEASAAGLAIVSTNAGGIPAIYENGVTAILVEPGDSHALAEAVEQVLQRPDLSSPMTQRAAMLVRKCEWQNVRPLLYSAYDFAPKMGASLEVGARCGQARSLEGQAE